MKRRVQMFVSVLFGAIAVLLVALWLRSYLVHETIVKTIGNHTYHVVIFRGGLLLGISPPIPVEDKWDVRMRGQIIPFTDWRANIQWTRPGTVRYWYFFVTAVLLAALPWMRARYSLRTLLIVTTVIALAIGLTIATS